MRDTLIPKQKQEICHYIRNMLQDVNSVSVMMDLWSKKNMEGFIGVSICGVTKSYSPFNMLLASRQVIGRHTGERIIAKYEDIIKSWGLEKKV